MYNCKTNLFNNTKMIENKHTIFSLSTPLGQSAIAVIRISGIKSLEIAKLLTKKKKISPRKVYYSSIYSKNQQIIDNCIILYFKSPRSFTGEDMLEIHPHGSIAIVNKILDELNGISGCRFSQPGEFSKRSYLNKKNSLIHFEGLSNLIASETESQRIIASKQTFGQSQNICNTWRKIIMKSLSLLDASIDFSEEDEDFENILILDELNNIIEQSEKLIKVSYNLKKIDNEHKILIFGPTNTGKSSLYNFLCQDNKAIVSSIKGTTTDQNHSSLSILGFKTTIVDSAGIRVSTNTIENEGIRKTNESLKINNNFILVLSPDSHNSENCILVKKIIDNIKNKNLVIIFNKSDLPSFHSGKTKWEKDIKELKKFQSLSISCIDTKNPHNMLINIYNFLNKNLISIDSKMIDSYYFSEKRQIQIIETMGEYLRSCVKNIDQIEIASDFLSKALSKLDELYGNNNIEDRLEYIFNNFCIGK